MRGWRKHGLCREGLRFATSLQLQKTASCTLVATLSDVLPKWNGAELDHAATKAANDLSTFDFGYNVWSKYSATVLLIRRDRVIHPAEHDPVRDLLDQRI